VRLAHLRRQAPGRVDGDVRVVADHVHAQLDRRVGHQAADLAQADHAQRVPGQLEPGEGLLAVLDPLVQVGVAASRPRRTAAPPAMLRAAISMPASTSSLTALALAPGALNTGTPRALIAGTGMLFVPGAGAADGLHRRCDGEQTVHVGRTHEDGVGVGDVLADL
jgi:hypothetical protein